MNSQLLHPDVAAGKAEEKLLSMLALEGKIVMVARGGGGLLLFA